ncbi:MAG: hypothetical protein AAGD38_00965 [Acidobacteriota bacterium]
MIARARFGRVVTAATWMLIAMLGVAEFGFFLETDHTHHSLAELRHTPHELAEEGHEHDASLGPSPDLHDDLCLLCIWKLKRFDRDVGPDATVVVGLTPVGQTATSTLHLQTTASAAIGARGPPIC